MQNFNDDDFDEDARYQSEASVVNISDDVVRFEVATQPGSKPRRYKLEPWSKAGSSVSLQVGYTQPFKGAGRGEVRATIESLTMREIIPAIDPSHSHPGRPGVRLPMVVHVDFAEVARARYVAAKSKRGEEMGASPVLTLHTEHGEPMRVKVRRAPEPVVEDVEDQGGALDEPPPDDNTPPSVGDGDLPEIPEVTSTSKGGRKPKA